jgi:PAS domain S-box-containing protein
MKRNIYCRCGVAFLTVAIATVLSQILHHWLYPTLSAFFFGAVAFSTWYGGIKSGTLCTLLSVLAINYFFVLPSESFVLGNIGGLLRLLAFLFVASLINLLQSDLIREKHKIERISQQLLDLAEEKIRNQEERWQLAIQSNNDGIWDHNLQTNSNYLSPRCLEIIGHSTEKIENFDVWLSLIHPNDVQKLSQSFQNHLDRRTEYYSCEYRVRCANGKYKWILSRGKAIYDKAGVPTRAVGSISDIDDRKHAEDAIRQREELLRSIADNIPDGTIYQVIRDPNGVDRLNYISSGIRRYGFEPQAVIANISLLAKQHFESDHRKMLQIMAESAKNLTPARYQVRRRLPSGEVRCSSFNSVPRRLEDGSTVWDGVEIDITDLKRTELALRESERRFSSLANTSPIGIFRSNLDGQITYVNDRCCQIVGLDRAEMLGKGWERSIHAEDRDRVLQSRLNSISNLKICDLEYRFLHGDGEIVWINAIAVPERDDRGKIIAYIGTLNDITDRKQAEIALKSLNIKLEQKVEERTIELVRLNQKLMREIEMRLEAEKAIRLRESEYKALAEHSPDLIARFDRQLHPLYINPAAQQNFGIFLDNFGNKTLEREEMSEKTYEAIERGLTDVFAKAEVKTIEVAIPIPQGEEKFYQTYLVPELSEAGVVKSVLSIARDLTELKKVDRLKNEFLSIVSHELRTPLTSIRGSLGLLATGIYESKPDKAKRMLEIAAMDCERLVRLVNDILSLERLESGRITLIKEICAANNLMEKARESLQTIADRDRIQLEVIPVDSSIFADIYADSDAILQVLTNLLSNAIKFSPPHSTITLSAELRENLVLFQVRDRGRGIPSDKLELIFQRFQQVDVSDSRRKGGTGLGLAICRQIIEQHGGKIWAESSLGDGSRFYFSLPAN